MARCAGFVVLIQCFLIFSVTSTDSNTHRDRYLKALINFLNSLPLRSYNYEDGFLLNVEQDIGKGDEIEAIIKASELNDQTSLKVFKCRAHFIEAHDVISIGDDYSCNEVIEENTTDKSEETDSLHDELTQVTEPLFVQKPVKLENEVQPDNSVTSGEQFIAIPRIVPVAPCVGCASSVNVDTPGVSDLALIGLQHLDRHNPTHRHTLESVLEVQRQVQVVNGVRFILTLNVNFNNCTENSYNCEELKVCKISILEKPWLKLPNGSKFRAVVSNNCTEEWLFYENENSSDPENKDTNETVQATTEQTGEDNVRAVQDTGLQSQVPAQDKQLNENEIKAIEKQIIPHHEFNRTGGSYGTEYVENINPNEQVVKKVEENSEAQSKPVDNEKSLHHEASTTLSISEGKKKAIDDLMNFFAFNDPTSKQVKYRVKKSIIRDAYHNKREIVGDVDCWEGDFRCKRKLAVGGLQEQDPSEPQYKVLAEKSLLKYYQESGVENSHKIVKVSKVTTQVVAGSMTRIDFDISPTSCLVKDLKGSAADSCTVQNLDVVFHCHSEIWRRPWLPENEEITITCQEETTSKREMVVGGSHEQDPSEPQYKVLAEKSLLKYYQESGVENSHKIVNVSKVTTQVVAGTMTRIDFDISPTICLVKDLKGSAADSCTVQNSDVVFHCHSEIWRRPWLPENEEITITCQEETTSKREMVVGGSHEQDPSEPQYKVLAEKSLLKYYQEAGVENSHKIVKVSKVTTQVVSGTMTRIDFDISPTICLVKDLKGSAADSCTVQNSDVVFHCHSEVWSRPWLPGPEKEIITITCQEGTRSKREMVVGGLHEQDPSKPKYKVLAEKSLLKFYQESSIDNAHKIVKLSKVTTQVVAGTLTIIEFDISPTSCLVKDLEGSAADSCFVQNLNEVLHCHSEVWSRPWLPGPEKEIITITCQEEMRSKREMVVGGLHEQDPSEPQYKVLAEKSLLKYYQESGVENSHKIVKVSKVTTQVVAGTMTRIDFDISPTICLVKDLKGSAADSCTVQNSDVVFHCHSEVWSRPWLPGPEKEIITITCQEGTRSKREMVVGGLHEQDPSEPQYKVLAEKSLLKYYQESGVENSHKIVKVSKVTTQVVAGTMTRIDFDISPTICLVKDLKGSAADSCTVQNSDVVFHCHSEVWSRPWLPGPEKEIVTITCQEGTRSKREMVVGGLHEQDPSEPQYKVLAEKSLLKYYQESGVENSHKIVKVSKVTTQVVAGTMTRIDFDISPTICLVKDLKGSAADSCTVQNSDVVFHCHSEVWSRPWLPGPEKEIITITCQEGTRSKREMVVGDSHEQDPSEPQYKVLAEKSLLKYYQEAGVENSHKIVKVSKVTTQVVAGTMTRIDFDISPTSCLVKDLKGSAADSCTVQNSDVVLHCHSEVWSRPWLPGPEKEIITITCQKGTRAKRALALGAPVEQDPTKSEFIKLADRSMSKFYEMYSVTNFHKIIKIKKVTTQPVSGTITRIDFDISPTTCSIKEQVEYSEEECPLKMEPLETKSHVLQCHSEIWNRPWSPGGEEITIRCSIDKSADPPMSVQDPRDFYITDGGRAKRHIDNSNEENSISNSKTKTKDREDSLYMPLDNFPEQAKIAREISDEVLKHIEKKYPYIYKQKVKKVSMLARQDLESTYYVVKFEVGYTNCSALTTRTDCVLVDMGLKLSCTGHVQINDHSVKVMQASCDDEDHTTDIYQHLQADHLFREFITTYKPNYINNRNELRNRYNIFKNNIDKMQEFNVLEKGSATYGVTRFSDLTYEEFSGKYLGLKPNLRDDNLIPMTEAVIPDTDVLDKFDWRDHGAVTEVKNQGSCGSCWAFSVTGNIEGQWKLKKGELVSLSEQELVDCDELDKGCSGGLPDNAYRAIEELGGLETEMDYPYEGVNDKCSLNKTMLRVQITGAVNISSDEVKMAKWLTENGPISIGINANAMQFYVGGISHPWHMLCNPLNLDHGVLIVGYGVKNYPVFKKTLPYWTIKNSWGNSWGEQGYYRVYRGDGSCGVNKMASSSIV